MAWLASSLPARGRPSDGALLCRRGTRPWEHPTRGLLPASEFIAVAEETASWSTWALVFAEACRQLESWRRDYRNSRSSSGEHLAGTVRVGGSPSSSKSACAFTTSLEIACV